MAQPSGSRGSKQSWRRWLGESALRMCGVCAGGCGRTAPQSGGSDMLRRCNVCGGSGSTAPQSGGGNSGLIRSFTTSFRSRQKVAPSSDEPLDNQQEIPHGENLVNKIIEMKWPYISSWFTQQMKESVEPELKRYIAESVELRSCDLGKKPVQLQKVYASTYNQDCQNKANKNKNIMVVGELDFHSDGEICVIVGTDGRIARVTLTSLKVEGTLVVELVRLQDMPPWCSGMRVHFPDPPQVDLSIHAEVFVLDKFLDMEGRVKSIVLDQLRGLINQYVVLPNQFSVGFAQDLDPFQLRHPVPQGVLRVAVESSGPHAEADGSYGLATNSSPGTEADSTSTQPMKQPSAPAPPPTNTVRVSWRDWLTGKKAALNTEVDISIGTTVKQCKVGETCDFLLSDWKRQHVEIVASGVKTSLPQRHQVAELVKKQKADQPAAIPLDLPDLERGLFLQAHWRPSASLQEVSRTLALPSGDSRWAIGEPCSGTWLLLVDLYYATALPHAENGTEHWTRVTVRDCTKGKVLAEDESPVVHAGPPSQHVLEHLRGHFPRRAEDVLHNEVAPDVWRQFLGRPVAGQEEGSKHGSLGLMDAVWEHPFRMMLGSIESNPVMDAIRTTEILLTVWRPERGLLKEQPGGKQIPSRELGSVCFRLAELFQFGDFCKDETCALKSAQTNSHIRFRVQARPLQMPPASVSFLNHMGSEALRVADQVGSEVTRFLRLGSFVRSTSAETSVEDPCKHLTPMSEGEEATNSMNFVDFVDAEESHHLGGIPDDDVLQTPATN